ncbi:MAG TPA: polyphosphate kinase 2 family protein [Tepidisphaeraceae bacterium]|nr:polyphosphate kinase 2 family protein [Tepidisphaeraceae bacterium]
MIDSPYLVEPGKKVKLSKFPTDATGKFKSKSDVLLICEKNLKKLAALQEVLYAQSKHAILIVFQAMDAGGKDGAIDHVFSGVNPQGCSVTSFKAPSALELGHDYLWRIHAAIPKKGMIGIFNRSHYESVLVERVHELVPRDVWEKRYKHINQFEKLLSDEGTTIIKFFLHISRDEQRERMEARLADKTKNWKFDPNDLLERKRWDDYMEAYEDAMEQCSTKHAPWYIVPSDHKWFRNWFISDTIVRTMEGIKLEFPKPIEGIEKIKID